MSVLISIRPQHVKNICEVIGESNGKPLYKKTIEVRKSRPKLETPFKCYIYCTIGNGVKGDYLVPSGIQCGKVIGEFVCDSFYGITNFLPYDGEDCHHSVTQGVLEQTCLEDYEIDEYLGKKDGYGWHITDLKIYDKPKELSEFKRWNRTEENSPCAHTKWLYPDCKDCDACNLTRPPQSWCYVEALQNG